MADEQDNSNDYTSDYDPLFQKYGTQYGIDPSLLKAQAMQESSLNPNAVGPQTKYGKASGLVQLIPSTAESLGVTDPNDPDQAIKAQAQLMAENVKRYGNIEDALHAYHGGTNEDNWGPKTKAYAQNVQEKYQKLASNSSPTTTIAGPAENVVYNPSDDPDIKLIQDFKPSNDNTSATATSGDPDIELIKNFKPNAEVSAQSGTQNATAQQQKPGIISDVAQTIPSAIIKGVGAIPQAFSYGGNLVAQGEGQLYKKYRDITGNPLTDQQAYAVEHVEPFITGNTIADTAVNVGAALAKGGAESLGYKYSPQMDSALNDLQKHNPVTGSVSDDGSVAANLINQANYEPQTAPGRVTNALIQGSLGAKGAGANALTGAGAGTTSGVTGEVLPDNPLAQLGAGLIGGGATAGVKKAASLISGKAFASLPEEIVEQSYQGKPTASAQPNEASTAGDYNKLIKAMTPEDIAKESSHNKLIPETIQSPVIPGVKYTLAQATGDTGLATTERSLRSNSQSFNGKFAEQAKDNASARLNYFHDMAGTPADVDAMEAARDAKASPAYDKARTQQLNPETIQPVISRIDAAVKEVGSGSDAGKTLLEMKSKINGAMPSMESQATTILDAQGNPISTPKFNNVTQSPLIQIYRETRDNLNKPSQQQGAYGATVKSVIQPINSALGDALEAQSPSFAEGQQTYRDSSPAITAAKYLQNLNLKDAQGNFTLQKVNNAYENTIKLRNTAPTTHPANSLSDAQLAALKNLRDDLRVESNSNKGMPPGSNTVQQLASTNKLNMLLGKTSPTIAGKISNETIGSAVGGAAGGMLGIPGTGAFLGDLGGRFASRISDTHRANALNRLEQMMSDSQTYKNSLLPQ